MNGWNIHVPLHSYWLLIVTFNCGLGIAQIPRSTEYISSCKKANVIFDSRNAARGKGHMHMHMPPPLKLSEMFAMNVLIGSPQPVGE